MPVVQTIRDKCKRCYSCVRNCPARAIKIIEGQAEVIKERCIGCGNCVLVCAQKAKKIESGIEHTEELLRSGNPVYALLAPSFPAAFPDDRPGQLVSALRQLGFARVVEVAVGADMIAREYARLFRQSSMTTIISTPCPAIVEFIQKYHPALILHMAPIVSPMIATGRAVKAMYDPDCRLVFIGPCIAKKKEKVDQKVAGV
ncbi:MAG: 4Fe-4S binding protein, partial [candidate division KSB1 bacterium]|nr:4Fe-4S binding protein [candidate division KSB1 bacterium]